jgi:hypothetical protein
MVMNDNRFSIPVPDGYVIYCGIFTVNKFANSFFQDKNIWKSLVSGMNLSLDTLVNGAPQEIVLSEDGDNGRKDMQTLFYEGVVNGIYPLDKLRMNKF